MCYIENQYYFMAVFTVIKYRFRSAVRWLLKPPILWMANTFTSFPKQNDVNHALSELYSSITREPGKKGKLIDFKTDRQPVIIFSDHHKGARNGSDDFAPAEKNYLAAMEYYNNRRFFYINLGDSEELWENTIFQVLKHNKATFEAERKFVDRNAYAKIVGNHDLFWGNDPFAGITLKNMYGKSIDIYTGVVLRTELPNGFLDFFCTHGHQGDAQSDGNAFSKWFVSYIWGPLQAFLEINTNSPSTNDDSKSLHNQFMYEWSRKQTDVVLITGHTHQPVFNSLTHLERLYLKREEAMLANDQAAMDQIDKEIPKRRKEYDYVNSSYRHLKPTYFNSGCCCFDRGTITGLEIADAHIRLVKWVSREGISERVVAEEISIYELARKLGY